MGTLTRPALAPGPLRTLSEALHRAHHLAGRPSLRDLATEVGCSRTTVSAAFSEPRAPRWGLLELLAEALGADVDDFHRLWLAATGEDGAGDETVRARRVPTATLRQAPPGVTGFAGRVETLDRLDELARPAADGVPIALLTGTAGVGKTALGLEWAHRRAAWFPGGTLYADLHGYHHAAPATAHDVLGEFLRALGVASAAVPTGTRERAALFRSLAADRRILLVLDNARSVEQVQDLLPAGAGSAVLVTSRSLLTGLVVRYGARRLPVDLLPEREALALLTGLVGPRVRDEPVAAAALAASCARLPLALRVAAELVATRPADSIADLVAELSVRSARLTLLDGGDEHSAVRTVFSWSYDHLPPRVAGMFAALGLHPGSHVDAGAAGALTGVDLGTAGQMLDELCRGHLLERLSGGRYRMHELLRAYAAELAAADPDLDAAAATTRLYDRFCAEARAAVRLAFPDGRPDVPPPTAAAPQPTGGGLRWLAAERPNLLAVAQASPRHAVELSEVLALYLDSGAHYSEARTLHELAGRWAAAAGDPQVEAAALDRLGAIKRRQGEYQAAMADHRRAARLSTDAGDPVGLGRSLQNLGIIAWRRGRYVEALEHLDRALALHRDNGDRVSEGGALYSLGIVHRRLGNYPLALDCHEQALAILEASDDVAGVGRALNNLAVAHLYLGHPERAGELLERALEIQRHRRDQAAESAVLTNLGLAHARGGRFAPAEEALRRARTVAETIGYPVGVADALRGLGIVCTGTGRYDEGEALLREAVALGARLDEGEVRIGATRELGELLLAAGRLDEATATLTDALRGAAAGGDRYEEAKARLGLARAYGATGAPDRADHERKLAAELLDALGIPATAVSGS